MHMLERERESLEVNKYFSRNPNWNKGSRIKRIYKAASQGNFLKLTFKCYCS